MDLYFWHYRARNGKSKKTRHRCTEADAKEQFGADLIGPVEGSLEQRPDLTPEDIKANSTSMVNRLPD